MTIDIDKFLSDIYNSTSVRGFFNNPIYIAIAITLIVIIIVVFMFHQYRDEDDDFWSSIFRSGIYILLPTLGLLFLHYKNTEREFEEKYTSKQEKAVIMATTGKGEGGIADELFGDEMAQIEKSLDLTPPKPKIN